MTKDKAEKILGLKGTYDEKTLEKAYRMKAKEVHGDITGSDEEMIQVNLAYEFLKNRWNKNSFSSFNNYENYSRKRHEYLINLYKIIHRCDFLKKNHADYFGLAYDTIVGLIASFKIVSGTIATEMDNYYATTLNGIKGALMNLANSFIQKNGLDTKDFKNLNYDGTLQNFYSQLFDVVIKKDFDIGKIGILKEKLKKVKGYEKEYSKVVDTIIEDMLIKAIKLGYVGTSKESEIIEEYKILHDKAFCRYLEGELWNAIKNLYNTEVEVKGVIEVWLIYFKEKECKPEMIKEILELARKTNRFENVFNNLVDEYSRLLKLNSTYVNIEELQIRIKKIHELIELLVTAHNNDKAKKDVNLQCVIRKIDLNDLESIENGLTEINKILNNKSGFYFLKLKNNGYYHGKTRPFNLFMLKNSDDSLKMCYFPSFTKNYLVSDYMENFEVSNEEIEDDFIPLEDFLDNALLSYGENTLVCEKIYGEFVICLSIVRNGEIMISVNYKNRAQKKGEKLSDEGKKKVIKMIKLIFETKYQRNVKKAKK